MGRLTCLVCDRLWGGGCRIRLCGHRFCGVLGGRRKGWVLSSLAEAPSVKLIVGRRFYFCFSIKDVLFSKRAVVSRCLLREDDRGRGQGSAGRAGGG